MDNTEKTLVLGALFHDVGKFIQRCEKVNGTHQILGTQFFDGTLDIFINKSFDLKPAILKILGSETSYKNFLGIIENHHSPKTDLEKIVQAADHISASERPELQKEDFNSDEPDRNVWRHKYLATVFSKINIKSENETKNLYFEQTPLTKKRYTALIPVLTEYDQNTQKYNLGDLEMFRDDLFQILSFYKDNDDFQTVINLLLVLLEKYLWCIPDFTGSEHTDISLYNHLKDVAGLSLAIYKTQLSNPDSKKLNLVIGDIPGIQDYIFDLYSAQKVAKILRGRSIFVQVLSSNFSSVFLKEFGLTECNLVMLAGGKFYIVAQNDESFKEKFDKVKVNVEDFLWQNLNGEISLNTAYTTFDYEHLKSKEITFGSIIEEANLQLIENKKKLFWNKLFEGDNISNNFVFDKEYLVDKVEDSNKLKCSISDKPIFKGQRGKIPSMDDLVSIQIETEFKLGDKITDDNIVIEINKDGLTVNEIFPLSKFGGNEQSVKILLNPDLDKIVEIIKAEPDKLGFLKNSRIIEVASYVCKNEDTDSQFEDDVKGGVMSFKRLVSKGEGAEFLTMIKGDIDNLGLIMALGFDRDNGKDKEAKNNSLSAISRTTTLSNHLKYFFSFYVNKFLQKEFPLSYTIFAGGDDIMLVCPQSIAVDLVDTFNKRFNQFVCNNEEIHISYSITHFKPKTPVKLVNIFAEENQDEVKKNKESEKNTSFESESNKSSTYIFDTKLKNSELGELKLQIEMLSKWIKENEADKNKGISMGVLRNFMRLVEIRKEFTENVDSKKIIWHPLLTYLINRNLKRIENNELVYKDLEVEEYFERFLDLTKNASNNFVLTVHPAICGAIYKLRKKTI